ncbi:hypothetical protein B0H11DRAFT_1981715 [Mycena galericulata]|nr:hypothetical protein B0H11DRAFT_1981715 [Mycena galericulata]
MSASTNDLERHDINSLASCLRPCSLTTMKHNLSCPTPKHRATLSHSFRRAFDLRRFETARHRRTRLEASKMNDLVLVASLPAEILEQIFLFCVSDTLKRKQEMRQWLAVTQVSHRWREISLGCPQLWANIIFHPKLMPIMLMRSKTVPLVMRIDLELDKHFKPAFVRENISRVGLLDVRGSRTKLETFLRDYSGDVSVRCLTNLSVHNNDITSMGGTPMWLDARLFPWQAKRDIPRQLRLECCALPWNSPWYSNLTDLFLADLLSAQGPSLNVLFSIIAECPRLQHLTLIEIHAQCDDWKPILPIELSHLRTIHLSEPLPVCAQILVTLRFPAVKNIYIGCLSHLEGEKPETWTIPSIVGHPDCRDIYSSLRVSGPMTRFVRLSAASISTEKTLLVDIFGTMRANVLGGVLVDSWMKSVASLTSITSLELSIPYHSWYHLDGCHYLETLDFHGGDPSPIFRLLLERAMRCIGVSAPPEDSERLGPNGACMQLFPKLECISILRSLLWARRVGRCPIPRLRLEDCKNLFKQDLAHFNALASVSWDGWGKNPREKPDGGDSIRSFSLNVYELLVTKDDNKPE